MNVIAVIPARSGSKGLKDKNIKTLCDRPLLAYTIQAAIQSQIFEEVYLSTDSEMYAKIGRAYGASTPFLRSPELSSDHTSTWDVIQDVLINYKKAGKTFENVIVLQPTSPMRNKKQIQEAYLLFLKKNAEAVVSVCETEHPVQWCFQLKEDLNMINFAKSKYRNMRRQELPVSYRENGAIYITKTQKLLEGNYDIYSEECYGYIMSREDSIDIDTELDFRIAEQLINNRDKEF